MTVRRNLSIVAAAIAIAVMTASFYASPSHAAPPVTATGDLAPSFDFDGDGLADLAIGVPGESIGTARFAGAVNVIYGTAAGLRSTRNQLWSQANAGVAGHPERGDGFGGALAGADFNGDGRDDLAVGASGEGIGGKELVGSVNVLYGSKSGLTAAGNDFWSQASSGVPGAAEAGDEFGGSLATGNFNGDQYDDLAVGSPQEKIGDQPGAGSVTVLYGSASGLRSSGSSSWTQASGGLDQVGRSNLFGEALAVGDVDRDGFADLAVGAPSRSYGEDTKGVVLLFFGSRDGLVTKGAQLWSQDSPEIADAAENDDAFGADLAFGDFDGDGHADLGIGVPGEGFGQCQGEAGPPPVIVPCASHGAVHVLLGAKNGLRAAGSQFWHKGTGGLPGLLAEGDRLGSDLVAGDFNGDQLWELALRSGDGTQGGAVYVLAGSAAGLTATGLQVWTQDFPGISGTSEAADIFGGSLNAGAYAGGARHALAIGSLGETMAGRDMSGRAVVLYGSTTGLTATGSQSWSQASAGIRGSIEAGDRFGSVDGQGRSTG